MPGADVALGVGVHGLEAGVPEEPDVLFAVRDGRGVEEVVVDVAVGAEVEEVGGDGMETFGYWILVVDLVIHR